MIIRASLGTLAAMNIEHISLLVKPTTAYLLMDGGCWARCAFCPQSRWFEADKELLSRVPWPRVDLSEVVRGLQGNPLFRRVCIQTVLKPGLVRECANIVKEIRSGGVDLPVSVAITPVSAESLSTLKKAGVDRIGVGLDAASPAVLRRVGKPYSWEAYWRFIRMARQIFGEVTVHLIFGLGESEKEFLRTVEKVLRTGCSVALFAFTPVPGTPMASNPRPPLTRYRVVQAVTYWLARGYRLSELVKFRGDKSVPLQFVLDRTPLEAFLTRGCPGCNRPFYNEDLRSIYNYPSPELLTRDADKVLEQLRVSASGV